MKRASEGEEVDEEDGVVGRDSGRGCSCIALTELGVLRCELNGNRVKERKESGRTGCRGRAGRSQWLGVMVEAEIGQN